MPIIDPLIFIILSVHNTDNNKKLQFQSIDSVCGSLGQRGRFNVLNCLRALYTTHVKFIFHYTDGSNLADMSSRYREWDLACKVYVGNLGSSASKHEIELAFGKFGQLRNVWVARNPPGFAFVEFEDRRDAEDAVRDLDGKWVYN